MHYDTLIYSHSPNKYRCIVLPHVRSFLLLPEIPSILLIIALDPERSRVGMHLYGSGSMSMKTPAVSSIYTLFY